MKVASLVGFAALAALTNGSGIPRDYYNHDYYVLHVDPSTPVQDVAHYLGLTLHGPLADLDDHHVLRSPKTPHDLVESQLRAHRRRRRQLDGRHPLDSVLLAQKQKPRKRLEKRLVPPPPPHSPRVVARADDEPVESAVAVRAQLMKTLHIADPIFNEQWHLFNSIQVGHDVNATGLWLEGITGKNATVAIVDDGIDMHSRDLKDNYFAEGSWDFNDHDPEPAPVLSDDKHGTRCAGEVAAVRNDVCGVGVAYDSRIAGIRILSKPISDADEAEAMIYKYQQNHIYSCSWGPRDDGKSMEAPGVLIRRAILKAIQKGRGGLGTIYVFASGNGAANDDNCNFDGYTNSIYSITVGAVDRAGRHPYYSELCSAQLVVTYSSGSGDSIHTTDVGVDKCATGHGGTSAAAPLAAGIFALLLQVRPDLGWRDVQYLAMETAVPIDDKDADWQKTSIGKQYSHVFGYGKIDSYALIQKAKDWVKVKPQAWFFSPWLHVKKAIPEGEHGLIASFDITEEMVKQANLARVEHVTVTMNVHHTRRGDLNVDLISPERVISRIATARRDDDHKGGYKDWTFMTVAHWGESGIGKWTLIVRDINANEHQGTLIDWHLKLWGESIDAQKAVLLPLPSEDDDADHDDVQSTVIGPVATSSIPSSPSVIQSNLVSQPSDHPERPTKIGPNPTTTTTERPSGTGSGLDQTPTPTPSSSWISKLPLFGASKAAKIWIYGALILIIAFCLGLGLYLWLDRRRRLRNDPRNSYEFELLDGNEREGLNGKEKGTEGGKNGRQTRGGELYDAFAGGSDDEEDLDQYRDDGPAEKRARLDRPSPYVVGDESDEGEGPADGGEDLERPLGSEPR